MHSTTSQTHHRLAAGRNQQT